MYHNFSDSDQADPNAVSVAAARGQLEYLRRHFCVVSLTHLAQQLRSGAPLARNTVVLTVDDGRRNFYQHFFPLLKEFQVPATFFVVSSFIRQEDWLWTDKVLWLAEQPVPADDLSPNRIEHFFEALNRLRPEVRNSRIESLARGMGVSIPKLPLPKYAPCSWSELREMVDSGWVEIGSHTVTHPILASLTDQEVGRELTMSRLEIEEGLSRKVESFCFPNGKQVDYRPHHLAQVRDAGYTSAVVTRFGMAGKASDVYELPRMGVSGKSDFLAFAKCVDGAEYYQQRVRQRFVAMPD